MVCEEGRGSVVFTCGMNMWKKLDGFSLLSFRLKVLFNVQDIINMCAGVRRVSICGQG